MPKKNDAGSKAEHHYFRVVITYNDGETSGNRVFKDRAKAGKFAVRQEKSPVVKRVKIEEFKRDARLAKNQTYLVQRFQNTLTVPGPFPAK